MMKKSEVSMSLGDFSECLKSEETTSAENHIHYQHVRLALKPCLHEW